MPTKPEANQADETVIFLLNVIRTASDFKADYKTLAEVAGINNSHNSQRKFKSIVDSTKRFKLENNKIVLLDHGGVNDNEEASTGKDNAKNITPATPKTPKTNSKKRKVAESLPSDDDDISGTPKSGIFNRPTTSKTPKMPKAPANTPRTPRTPRTPVDGPGRTPRGKKAICSTPTPAIKYSEEEATSVGVDSPSKTKLDKQIGDSLETDSGASTDAENVDADVKMGNTERTGAVRGSNVSVDIPLM